MFKRYSEIVDHRLDEIASAGWTHITWRELCCWYETSEVTREIWLDIQSRLEKRLGRSSAHGNVNIYVIGNKENGFVLAKADDCQRLADVIDTATEASANGGCSITDHK